MFQQLERFWGRKFSERPPLSDLTVQSVAAAAVRLLPPSPVIEVQPGNPVTHIPFFYIHGDIGGGGLYSWPLAASIGPEQPFYLLQHRGLYEDDEFSSIEEMTQDHLAALRQICPKGPYLLGGYCNGALAAFEMARILSADESVGLVVMIEPLGFEEGGSGKTVRESHAPAWRDSPQGRIAWLFGKYSDAVRRYRRQPYSGKIDMFWATEQELIGLGPLSKHKRAGRAGSKETWKNYASELESRILPGTHTTCLGRHYGALGRELAELLKPFRKRQ
jgi:thioesterase domain-containing protein